jgi:hypothetical protein
MPGLMGARGYPGPAGVMGLPGLDGEDGLDGIPGLVGATGATGATGSTGSTGATGTQGPTGPMGFAFDGTDGEDGIGLPGAVGPRGLAGPRGFDGVDGLDADESYSAMALFDLSAYFYKPGRIGGQSAIGGVLSSDNLDLYANDEALAAANTGRIRLHERLTFSDNFSIAATLSTALLAVTGTVTITTGIAIWTGFSWAPTLSYNTAQTLSGSPAFFAGPIIQPTATVTDSFTLFTGFTASPVYLPNGTGITPLTPVLAGFFAEPQARITLGTSAIVSLMCGYAAFDTTTLAAGNIFGGIYDVGANVTVPLLAGFHCGDPYAHVSAVITDNVGLNVKPLSAGANNLAVRAGSAIIAKFAPSSFTIQTGYCCILTELEITGTNVITIEGTGMLVVVG